MRLARIQIKNFRGLRDVTIDFDDTTLLIGENNCGKTSVLEALRLAMTRIAGRRAGHFDTFDYHLPTRDSEPQNSDPISITATMKAGDSEQLHDEFTQTLNDVLVTDKDSRHHIVFRVSSGWDATVNDFSSEWQFLDVDGNPLGSKSKRPSILQDFQKLFPVFYLSALRDAVREFRSGPYWSPFVRNPSIPPAVKAELQKQISLLNAAVLDAHVSLKTVKSELAKVQDLVPVGKTDTVDIEALPARISDLLSNTQVSICGSSGASIPLGRHGAGTQSLSVLFLFQAYLTVMLKEQYNPLSTAILALEEPEAHLHPFATRSLWHTLSSVPGQKIIASHSGDLVANAPLMAVRRLYSEGGEVKVGSVGASVLGPDDARKIQFHVTKSRGELLFARCWLLIEGESEYWMLSGLADILGRDLDRWGVRMVAYRQSGHGCLITVANCLGIPWFLVADGDQQGKNTVKSAEKQLGGANASDRILKLDEDNVELHLCACGLGSTFEAHISPQKKGSVTSVAGTQAYWKEVLKAQDDSAKPALIQEVIAQIEKGAPPPPKLLGVLDHVLKMAGA